MTKYKMDIPCYLTDNKGNILNPYENGSLSYTELSSPANRFQAELESSSGEVKVQHFVSVLIEGYIAYSIDGSHLSTPVYFSIIRNFCLYAPRGTALTFTVDYFKCCAVPCFQKKHYVEVRLELDIIVNSEKNLDLLMPEVNDALCTVGKSCINVDKIYDSVAIQCNACILCESYLLKAEVYQYNTISDGHKRIYTNADEIKKYGDRGILPPHEVSYYNLFVNGVLQARSAYKITEGVLELLTDDLPTVGASINIVYFIYKTRHNRLIKAYSNSYNAIADGKKRKFRDRDALKDYGCQGIPSPYEVSLMNLYINGVLQPRTTYIVRKGLIELTTEDVPVRGAMVTLDSVSLFGSLNQLIKSQISLYNTYSDGQKTYTNQDEIKEYGGKGIPDPALKSYQNLYVNSVIQPSVSYIVQKGLLTLITIDAPSQKSPVTLQSAETVFTVAIRPDTLIAESSN